MGDTMSGVDVSDTVSEISDEMKGDDIINKQWVAVYISIVAVLLTIATTCGQYAMADVSYYNVAAGNSYSFYQAKTIRSTVLKVALEDAQTFKAALPNLPNEAIALLDRRIDAYLKTIDRYESDPANGDGRKELKAQAAQNESLRNHAERQDPYYSLSEALLEIAIVLASVCMVAQKRWLLWLSYTFSLVAVSLTTGAFFLI